MEKGTLFMSFFSMAAWTDLMMSWVCSMLMFQVAWTQGVGKSGKAPVRGGVFAHARVRTHARTHARMQLP